MEKLTIEQKAKRYNEAIKIAKSKIKNDKDHVLYEEDIIEIFPELKENDDELTWLTNYISEEVYSLSMDIRDNEDRIKLKKLQKSLAWLKKQSKNKPIERNEFTSVPFEAFDSELYESMITIPDGCVATIEGNKIHIKRESKSIKEIIKEEKVDNANKLKSKFKIGDYVVRKDGKNFNNNEKFAKVIKINKTISQPMYLVDCENWLYEDEIKLWTLTDAQDGDVLISSFGKPFIYNGWSNESNIGAYCGIDIYNMFVIANKKCNWASNCNIRPATEEECQLLFNEIKLLGLAWNPKAKKLNRIDK